MEGELGTVAPEALADLVVLRDDPSDDISILAGPGDERPGGHEGRRVRSSNSLAPAEPIGLRVRASTTQTPPEPPSRREGIAQF